MEMRETRTYDAYIIGTRGIRDYGEQTVKYMTECLEKEIYIGRREDP